MTDETPKGPETAEEPVDVVAVVAGDESGIQAEAAVAVQGDSAIIVAQFADMDTAKLAYEALLDAEMKRAIDIDGVLVVNADYQGKIHVQKMTDHTTRNGFLWGAVAGVVVGIIFPPSVLASAATLGVVGALAGKAGNLFKRGAVASELTEVIKPGTSGIVALVSLTAVDAVKETIPQATEVKAVPVDDETAVAVKEAAKAAGDTTAQ
ncbi:MAG: DUF1269 domain-containing protein [Chloroflexi bacterium]|jgi:uncharacterized membrane protein|nr:DUF1269 domain-containing protein [Chloroflexota bacterium]